MAHFVKCDILDVALYVKKRMFINPLVLVMGDPTVPGGKDHLHFNGLELDVWRRSAIRECLEKERRGKYSKKDEEDKFVYNITEGKLKKLFL